jgi:hypothetical protein
MPIAVVRLPCAAWLRASRMRARANRGWSRISWQDLPQHGQLGLDGLFGADPAERDEQVEGLCHLHAFRFAKSAD